MRQAVTTTLLLLIISCLTSCENLSDYSTQDGSCYVGNIIDADFVRAGAFDAKVRLTMSLDVDALSGGKENGAVITTSDGLFNSAPVKQMIEMTRDSLSLLDFPGGRVKSYLAYAPDAAGRVVNVVISLMENGDVETRIFRPSLTPDDALFGVFRLEKNEFCNAPEAKEIPDASDADNSTD
jgi:hypothetical protein